MNDLKTKKVTQEFIYLEEEKANDKIHEYLAKNIKCSSFFHRVNKSYKVTITIEEI